MQPSDQCLTYAKEEHYCPHCNTRLACCHCPPFHVGDGLGWGSEVMFVCLNDDCQLFVNGWKHCEEQYGHCSSYRYMLLPGETTGNAMMVGSKEAFTGSVIDPNATKFTNDRYEKEKAAVAMLDTCVAEHNLEPVLTLLLDESANLEGRQRACDLLVKLNDLACIDPIRNHEFRHTEFEQQANLAIIAILKANYCKECPRCAEIIKSKAKACKHCGAEFE